MNKCDYTSYAFGFNMAENSLILMGILLLTALLVLWLRFVSRLPARQGYNDYTSSYQPLWREGEPKDPPRKP